jgi:hypothetical protein
MPSGCEWIDEMAHASNTGTVDRQLAIVDG